MDALDACILRELGMEPFAVWPPRVKGLRLADVARELDVGHQLVKDRVAKMTEAGVIVGYGMFPNLRQVGLDLSVVHVAGSWVPTAKNLEMLNEVDGFCRVTWFLDSDLCVNLVHQNEAELDRRMRLMTRLTRVDTEPKVLYESTFPALEKPMSRLDWRIVGAMAQDAKRPIADVAKALGSGRAGLDLKYGITSTLVANATFNPDYSQVEADALQIDANQRFALFYPEKRPFFLEGAEIFDTDLDLVYTRRIADPDAGLKLTGKQGSVRIGAIAAYDGGGGSLAGTGAAGHEPVSREGFVGIGRLTLDLGDDNYVGLLYTDRRSRNEQDGGGVYPAFGPPAPIAQGGANSVYAVDGLWRLARPLFFEGQVAWSQTRVDSSSDYAGRRIATHGTYGDLGYNAELRYADGIREAELYQRYFGPEFRTEAGFVPRVDMRETGFDSDFIVRPENAWLRSWQPILTAYVIHDDTGGLQEWWASPMIDWVFQKSTHAHTMYVRSMERFLGREFDLNTYILNFDNSRLRQASLAFYSSFGDGIYYDAPTPAEVFKGWRESYTFEATLRPSSRVTSALTAQRSRFSREFGGEEIFDIWVMGANTTYQFTRRLYARFYPQYDTGDDHFDADFLLGYVVSPGTVLYLGYNGDFDSIDGRSRATQRSWFLKASYRFMR